jgi:hypothetical protein
MNVPSPHGLLYCLLVIDHHPNYMWVRFLRSKDDTCPQLESILLEIRDVHARHHSSSCAFAPIMKLNSDSVFEATATRLMCGRLGVVYSTRPRMLNTCLTRPNARGAHSETMPLRWSTSCPLQTPCSRARSTPLCTFATVRSAARLVCPVAFPSPSSRRRSKTRPSSASSDALPLPRCPTSSVASLGRKLSAALCWSATRVTPRGMSHLQPNYPTHHHVGACCVSGGRSRFPPPE